MQTERIDYTNKDNLLDYIRKNPGFTFRQLRFRLEMNESTLNNNLKSLLKREFLKKDNELRYFIKQ